MNLMDAAVDFATSVVATAPASGFRPGIYTPAGGDPVAAHGAVVIREEPRAGVQRRGASILLLQREIASEPTDGATYEQDGATYTIRTARRAEGTWPCEAWA